MKSRELRTIPMYVGLRNNDRKFMEKIYEKIYGRFCGLVILALVSKETVAAQPEEGLVATLSPLKQFLADIPSIPPSLAIIVSCLIAACVAIKSIHSSRVTHRRILTFTTLHDGRRDPVLTSSMQRLAQLDEDHREDVKSYADPKNMPVFSRPVIPDASIIAKDDRHNTGEQSAPVEKEVQQSEAEWRASRRAIMYVLSYYETLGCGVALGAYDERVIYRAEYSKIKSVKKRCEPFILCVREKFHRETLYKEFESMVSMLDKMEKTERERVGKTDNFLSRIL